MRDTALKATTMIEGLQRPDFKDDETRQLATAMSLFIIGESANKLAKDHLEETQAYTGLPWRDMRSMRNRIANGYFDLDWDVVWGTLTEDLPVLVTRIDEILSTGETHGQS